MQITKVRLLRDWLPPLIWTAVILTLSGNPGSSDNSGSLLRLVLPRLSQDAFELVNLLLRKSAHVVAYSLLGFLNFRAVRGPREGWRLPWSVAAVALAAIVAIVDEIHQSTTPTRSGHYSDVLLDTGSAILAQVFARANSTSSRA